MEEAAIVSSCKVLLIGGSAGSLEVLLKILPALPIVPSFALVIVLHRKGGDDNALEELIAAKSAIPVVEVEDKTLLLAGNIYIAPSDYHLLFETNGLLSLDASEKINFSRPSIDVCFESAAEAYGPQLVAILLSGANNDGTNGLTSIKNASGTTVVQNPETAEMTQMPQYAIEHSTIDFILSPDQMCDYIVSLNRQKRSE